MHAGARNAKRQRPPASGTSQIRFLALNIGEISFLAIRVGECPGEINMGRGRFDLALEEGSRLTQILHRDDVQAIDHDRLRGVFVDGNTVIASTNASEWHTYSQPTGKTSSENSKLTATGSLRRMHAGGACIAPSRTRQSNRINRAALPRRQITGA